MPAARSRFRSGHIRGRGALGPPDRRASGQPARRLDDRSRRCGPWALWGAEPLGAGTVNVFQKMFFRRLSLVNDSTGAVLFEETTAAPSLSDLVPDLASETVAWIARPALFVTRRYRLAPSVKRDFVGGGSVKLDKLISQGATLFFEQTFNGNGRTCGTCHPAINNFTIDAEFIATLPPNDPLFVAEFNPALAQLERPTLMRQFGLILENLDGFSSPTTKFVMRGVPHTLGLQVSLERDTSSPNPPAEMTGWSGDGSPGTGSLREFAIGAVTQHFTKRLQRVEGTDFKLPREHQLDAMEAFQLSLGRDKDFDLANITFTRRERQHRQVALHQRRRQSELRRHLQLLSYQCQAPTRPASEPEPQLQHERRRQGASRARRPEFSQGRRLRANE